MDYSKIDAALANALETVEDPTKRSLGVFIQTDGELRSREINVLREKGVNVNIRADAEQRMGDRSSPLLFTAMLSGQDIAELVRQPWVRYLKLSQKLRFLNSE